MALHNRKLSFTTPIVVGFAGILLSFMLIAIFVTLAQQKDFLEDYHDINRNFTHNLAINYTETLLRENDFILGRADSGPRYPPARWMRRLASCSVTASAWLTLSPAPH